MELERNVGDLSASNLHLYLTDPTFVEYLNSFLLLPAFSNRIFYNEDTGYFEMVHDEGVVGCIEDGSSRSSSAVTLFLSDDSFGPSLDKEQAWNWIIYNRLPLFLRSDIYSEYKICKKLSSHLSYEVAEKESENWKPTHPPSLEVNTGVPLQSIKIEELEEEDDEDLRQSQLLPDIPSKGSDVDLSSQLDQKRQRSQSLSSSQVNAQTSATKLDGSKRRFKWQRSSSVGPESLKLYQGSVRSKNLGLLSRMSAISLSQSLDMTKDIKGNPYFAQLLSTKSGMTEFWKFLKGKAGEKNWLFWLDAERVKYYDGKEQTRMLRELHEKYFHDSDCCLEVPQNIRQSISKSVHLTTKELCDIQEVMITGLIEYWCPRFLLHYYHEQEMSSDRTTPQLPNVFHPYSASSPIPLKSRDSKKHAFIPQTPSHTPTFKRIHMTTPLNPNPLKQPPSLETIPQSDYDYSRTSSEVNSPSPQISRKEPQIPPKTKEVNGCSSRADKLPTISQPAKRMASSATRYNQLAKYSARHLQDPTSQCASQMEGSDRDRICKSHCRILSISGTPVRPSKTADRQHRAPAHADKDTYKALFHCLAVENRKAGGYFMHFLEKLESKVYINSLLFWRDVQEYKALFVGKKFSPCAVEVKSKALFGHYISEGSSYSIGCSLDVIDIIYFNLKPAYEDLFDLAEEHAVQLLLVQWNVLCIQENSTFHQLDKVAMSCSSAASSRSKTSSLETMSEESIDFPLIESAINKSPRPSMTSHGPFRRRPAIVSFNPAPASNNATSLNDIINNPVELEHFKVFLNDKLAAQDLMCWLDIESFRGIPASDEVIRNMKAKRIKKDHLNKNYYFGPNSPASKETQRMTMQAGGGRYGARLPPRPPTPVLREVQKHVRARLEKKWLADFMMSSDFVERNRDTSLSGSWDRKMSMKVNQFSFEASFLQSHEALQFRKFLTQKRTANFERYLKTKAQSGQSTSIVYHPREDVEFWCEVQKYKAMCHAHTKGSTLSHKVRAIVDCYFCSVAPPELQIDIPIYMVEQIRKKDQSGPYLFREAQAAVFSNLYNGWKEYQVFVANLSEREEKKAIEKLKKDLIHAQKQKREKEENERLEEEGKKVKVPRFETAEEREQRIQHERELAEFGPVAVEFRLSSPDPWNYTYFTDLPDKYYAQEEGDSKMSRSPPSQTSLISHQRTSVASPMAGEGVSNPVVMRLQGAKRIPQHIRDRLKKPVMYMPATVKETDTCGGTPCFTDDSESMHKGNSNDSAVGNTEERSHRRGGHKGRRKVKKTLSSTFPRITLRTISMKMSTIEKGEAYAYGSGIIEEQSSFLEVTSKS